MKIGADAVDRALSSAPRQATVWSRDHTSSLTLSQGHSYSAPGSDCLYITDPEMHAN
jgi:trimethylamine:corrinoid methyltransferase-like protein